MAGRRVDVEPDRRDEAAEEAERRDAGAEAPAHRGRHEHGAEERDERRAEEREDRRDREPVDVRRVDHGAATGVTLMIWECGCFGHCPTNEWWLIAAGHAESSRSPATSGATRASSAGRTSMTASETVDPRASWRTAEMSRSMYIAASTIAPAPIAAHHQPRWKTPARMRNSPAKFADPGTASEITPSVMSSVESTGRPFAIPPSSANSPVVVRRSTTPATRKSEVDTSPCATICRTPPSRPSVEPEKSPSAMSPDCASEE